MSAFVVSNNHINEIVRYIDTPNFSSLSYIKRMLSYPETLEGEKLFQYIGYELMNENCKSVNSRYKTNEFIPFVFKRKVGDKKLSPVEILKLINCLDYQSCEHDTWKESNAYLILSVIKNFAISRLQGYENAEWTIH
jgi:hypothetical protein